MGLLVYSLNKLLWYDKMLQHKNENKQRIKNRIEALQPMAVNGKSEKQIQNTWANCEQFWRTCSW